MRLPALPGYHHEELLGENPYGWRFVCSHDSGERRVVQLLKSQSTNERLLQSYWEVFADPQSRPAGSVRVHEYRLAGEDSPALCITPFFGWRRSEDQPWQLTSLKRLMHLVSGELAFEIVRETAQSVASAHAAGLFHGGLRPGSIFLSGNPDGSRRVQLGDFGQMFMGGLHYLEAGDLLFYVSPEQMQNGDYASGGGYEWDVYALGVIAFHLLTGHLPRLDRLRQQALQRPEALQAGAIAYGQLTSLSERFLEQLQREKPVEWPDQALGARERALREVVEACLEFDPRNRPAAAGQVLEAIEAAGEKVEPPALAAPEESAASPEPVAGEATEEDGRVSHDYEESATAEPEPVPPRESMDEGSASRARPANVVAFFRDRPVLKWQCAAVASLLALLPLTWFAAATFWKLQGTRKELKVEAAELQANVEDQAATYRRALREKQREKRRNSQQIQAELNEVKDSRSRLLGEAKLARQILRETQESGDRFFRLVLENRDTDVPEFRRERAAALVDAREHYERLVEVYGDAPDFIVSAANALFNLGRIYKETGQFGKALASFGEAERRYAALLEDAESSDARFLENLAIAKHALGELSVLEGKYAIARHYFTQSSRFWSEFRAASPQGAMEAAVSIHENSLAVAECELDIGRVDAALDGARSIGMQLTKLQEEAPENDRIVGALAHSFALVGRSLEAREETGAADEAYRQAGDLYARAVKLNAAIDAYQLGLGDSLARVGLLDDDLEKLRSAVDVLDGVVQANPHEARYQKTLAEVYGVLARDQRDSGHAENAIELEREAISILRPILENHPDASPEVRHSYARRLAHLAELLGDAGEFDESRKPLQAAISLLEQLAGSERGTAAHRRTLARARGLAGFACLECGDESEAREHLELAKSEWENYVQSHPEDSDAAQAVRWTTDQLEGL